MLGRLEDHVSSMRHKRNPVILLEKNDELKGLTYIEPIYKAIVGKTPLTIKYQSFKSPEPQEFVFSPYFLKEFRNRWFVYGVKNGKKWIFNLALDRIHELTDAPGEQYIENAVFDPETYFDDLIGVSKRTEDQAHQVRFWAAPEQTPYIETKPLHKSQSIVQRNEDGSAVFQIDVILNYELERDLLGFGETVKVLSPDILVERLEDRLKRAFEQYR